MDPLHFCVFSFNRGLYLDNCIKSIEICAPAAKITIYDDNSNDPYTIDVLNKYQKKHSVVQPSADLETGQRFGGLYANMQLALDNLEKKETACFIQDDMQLVRRISEQDVNAIDRFFQTNPNAAFLHPAFLKGRQKERDKATTKWNEASGTYYREPEKVRAGVNFSAIFITRIDRLRQANWRLESRELLNNQKAENTFGRMGFLVNPFCFWLPNVPAYRGKTKTLALRIAEKIRKSDFYPFKIMSEDDADSFCQRDKSILPVAEDFLSMLDESAVHKPWIYSPMEGLSLLKNLNKLEIKLRKVFS